MDKEQFWTTVYHKNAPVLRGVIRRYVSDREMAEDLLQEVFITAIRKYDSYAGKGNFEAWLYRIAVNTALMHLRAKRPQGVSVDMVAVVNGEEPDGPEESESVRGIIETADFSNEELLAAIDRLPDHHKMVFNLYVIDGFSHKEIAVELNISPGTSKSHLARARKKIQQYLYEEAVNKKKKKSRRAFIFFIWPGKKHFLDKLYKDKLTGYSIPGDGNASFISETLGPQVTAPVSLPPSGFSGLMSAAGSKLSYILVSGATVLMTTTACWFIFGDPTNEDRKKEEVSPLVTEPEEAGQHLKDSVYFRTGVPADTFIVPTPSVREHISSDSFEKVVVKRHIIQHQTIVIRDTVIIEE